MRILYVVPENYKSDPIYEEVAFSLKGITGQSDVFIHPTSKRYEGLDVDVVVLMENTLTWFYANRMLIPGRYIAIGCSFQFQDLREFVALVDNMHDCPLSLIITNCHSLVAQTSGKPQMMFSQRPLMMAKAPTHECDFVSVISQIQDQDFSLALRASSRGRFRLYCHSAEVELLPPELRQFAYSIENDERDCYASGDCYIPTPRISDYRGGVIPSDYYKGLTYCQRSIFPAHPLIQKQLTAYARMYVSLTELDSALIAKGVDSVSYDKPERTSPADFARKIALAVYRMGAVNAIA